MTFIKINAAQATALRGKYGDYHELNPIALPDTTDYILTDAVLTHPAYAAAVDTLTALPTYPAWKTATAYSIGTVVEYGGRLWRNVQAHTAQVDWSPPVVPALWTTAHEPGAGPQPWVQPTGQQDSYSLGDLVTHNGRTWKSLTAANTYEPGQVGTWRDQSTPPLWVAPAGAIGAWQVNDLASYGGQTWRNTAANNTYTPGVYGWVVVP